MIYIVIYILQDTRPENVDAYFSNIDPHNGGNGADLGDY